MLWWRPRWRRRCCWTRGTLAGLLRSTCETPAPGWLAGRSAGFFHWLRLPVGATSPDCCRSGIGPGPVSRTLDPRSPGRRRTARWWIVVGVDVPDSLELRRLQWESKNPPEFSWHFFPERLGVFRPNSTHLFYVSIYARLHFYARQHTCYSAYMPRQFGLSVSLSHACFVSKRLKASSKFFHSMIGPSF